MNLLLPDYIKNNDGTKSVKSFVYSLKRKDNNGKYIFNESKLFNKNYEEVNEKIILEDNLPIENNEYTYNTYFDGTTNNRNKIGIVVVKKLYIESQIEFNNTSVYIVFDQDFNENDINKYESLGKYTNIINQNINEDNLLKDYINQNNKIYLNNIYKTVIEKLISDYNKKILSMIKIILCPQNNLCYSYNNITKNGKIEFIGLEYIENLIKNKYKINE